MSIETLRQFCCEKYRAVLQRHKELTQRETPFVLSMEEIAELKTRNDILHGLEIIINQLTILKSLGADRF